MTLNMVLTHQSKGRSYSNSFWTPQLDSTHGADILTKRNHESKKMSQDLEDYLKKRAKIEVEYSNKLAGLTKCFRQREETGVLEASFSALRDELMSMSQAHVTAAEQLNKMGDRVRKFRDDQATQRKAVEESLHKIQHAKLSSLTKTVQAQKIYVKRSVDRDTAELACNGLTSQSQIPVKDAEKLKSKLSKCDDEAQKADSNYKSAVMVLQDNVEQWEKEMTSSCEAIQKLDEERIMVMRREMWLTVNVDSKLALDIDNRCQGIRDVLEKCQIESEIQSFITAVGTGGQKPIPLEYTHYSRLTEPGPCPNREYDMIDVLSPSPPPSSPAADSNAFSKAGMRMFGTLGGTLGRMAKK